LGFLWDLEAPPGFEPGIEVLQTSALPLGDGAGRKLSAGRFRPRLRRGNNSAQNSRSEPSSNQSALGLPTEARDERHASEGWSGKRDSNPRLRPWQGRTLPLSYSRSLAKTQRTTAIFRRSRKRAWLPIIIDSPRVPPPADCRRPSRPRRRGAAEQPRPYQRPG
jgi:hypothetical protein